MPTKDQIERHRAEAPIRIPRPLWVEFHAHRRPSRGPSVVPITWGRYHQLQAEGNAILGGALTKWSALRALWILSPWYRDSSVAWFMFRVYHSIRYHSRTASELRAFILEAFLEAPKATNGSTGAGVSGGESAEYPAASQLGLLIAYFAKTCSYTPEQVLDLSIALTFQIYNALTGARVSDGGPAFNPVQDKVNGDRIRRKTAELRARAQAKGARL